MSTDETTYSMASLVGDVAGQPLPSTPVDWAAVAESYAAQARAESARERWRQFAADNPVIAETDWTRSQYDANRGPINSVRLWSYQSKGILASGETGRGKTRALVDLFRRLACDEGRDVRYWFAGDWFSTLQAQVNYGRDDARGWVEACAVRPIVILDDLGQEAMQHARQQWAQAWFFRFLDIRIARGLPLLVSTNLPAKSIAGGSVQAIGADPLLRRLLQLCEVVKFV